MSREDVDGVLQAIDGALYDTVSPDAMRWAPDAAAEQDEKSLRRQMSASSVLGAKTQLVLAYKYDCFRFWCYSHNRSPRDRQLIFVSQQWGRELQGVRNPDRYEIVLVCFDRFHGTVTCPYDRSVFTELMLLENVYGLNIRREVCY